MLRNGPQGLNFMPMQFLLAPYSNCLKFSHLKLTYELGGFLAFPWGTPKIVSLTQSSC
jgi:hypothetical protein